MSVRASTSATLDTSAIALSGLCLVHCLALPLMAAALPLAGVLAEAEWVHKAFVVTAIPISIFSMLRGRRDGGGAVFIGLASFGLFLLTCAAFIEPLHDHETALTVSGALCLATAHIYRWVRHSRA
jgi:hypothetical protein